jgi:hypothetical protein
MFSNARRRDSQVFRYLFTVFVDFFAINVAKEFGLWPSGVTQSDFFYPQLFHFLSTVTVERNEILFNVTSKCNYMALNIIFTIFLCISGYLCTFLVLSIAIICLKGSVFVVAGVSNTALIMSAYSVYWGARSRATLQYFWWGVAEAMLGGQRAFLQSSYRGRALLQWGSKVRPYI